MKKFTILMGLFLATVITGSAFAQPVTFTPEQIKKIEDHIVGLNTQIEELTAENKALKAEIAEANQKINAPSENADGVVNNLIGNENSVAVVDTCAEMAGIAATIMKGRQEGIPMSKILQMNKDNGWETVNYLVIEAYDSKLYSSPEYKQRSITEFENKVHLDCIKSK